MSHFFRTFGLSLIASILVSGQAFAHAHLKASAPADGATLSASPAEIALSLSEGLNLKFSGIELIGPTKAKVKIGEAKLTDSDKGLTVPIADKLQSGIYTVQWHVLSVDGHKTNGTYSFTITP